MLICKHCFLDAEMQSEVEANASSEGVCDVCHKQGKVIDSSEFADFFEALLSLFERSDAGKPVAEMVQDEWHLFADNHVAEVCWMRLCSYRRWAFPSKKRWLLPLIL